MLCSRCNVDQPRNQFGANADMWPRHRECKSCKRHVSAVKRHGLSPEDRQRIADAQGGCRSCGHDQPGTNGWVVDHDHDCCDGDASCPKCRRGVVCRYCNHMLGQSFDQPRILRAAADYLELPRDCSWHMPVACAPSICVGDASVHATYVNERNAQDGTHGDGLTSDESLK